MHPAAGSDNPAGAPGADEAPRPLLRRIFSLSGSRNAQYLRAMFLWNPLLTLGICFIIGIDKLSTIWPLAFLIATVVVSVSWLFIVTIEALERALARNRGRQVPEHGAFWNLGWALFSQVPGLLAAAAVLRLSTAWFGWPPLSWRFDNWVFYATGIVGGSFFCLMFFVLFYLRDKNLRAEAALKDLENRHLQSQLAAIRSQLNPHFLFNTLNTLADWVHTNPKKAEWMVLRLSDLFAGVLEATQKESHALGRELEICRAYLDLEQARFGEKLKAEFGLDKGLDAEQTAVPVLLLQPLVENAVRHGLSPKPEGGRVRVTGALTDGGLELAVEDDGVGFGRSGKKGSGTALENCRKRLALAYGTKASLSISPAEGGGTRVSVRLPLKENTEESTAKAPRRQEQH